MTRPHQLAVDLGFLTVAVTVLAYAIRIADPVITVVAGLNVATWTVLTATRLVTGDYR